MGCPHMIVRCRKTFGDSTISIAIATIPLRMKKNNEHPIAPYLENLLPDIYLIICFHCYISDRNNFTTLGNLSNPGRMIS
jgi:hypothetical protein